MSHSGLRLGNMNILNFKEKNLKKLLNFLGIFTKDIVLRGVRQRRNH